MCLHIPKIQAIPVMGERLYSLHEDKQLVHRKKNRGKNVLMMIYFLSQNRWTTVELKRIRRAAASNSSTKSSIYFLYNFVSNVMTLSNVILSQQKWFFIEAKTGMSLLTHSMPLQHLDNSEIRLRSKYKKLVLCCKLKFSSNPPEGHEELCLGSYILNSVWVWGSVQGSNSHSKNGVEHAHAGHKNIGSTRLAFGKMTTVWLCTTYLFPSANQLLPWKSFFSSQWGELFTEEFQISSYNSET